MHLPKWNKRTPEKEAPKLDQSVTNFYLKEINTLREELNKNKVLMKDLTEKIKNWQK